jgi:acetate kinase
MDDVIVVLNSGSSSIKFSAFATREEKLELKLHGEIEEIYSSPVFVAKNAIGLEIARHSWSDGTQLGHDGAISYLTDFLRSHKDGNRLTAVGHRVVHGGSEYTQPTFASPEVLSKLEKLTPLAPLHQPHNLAPIRFISQRMPGLPQVVCFDTAFHRAQPELAQAFALPRSISDHGVRRYGFHGLSYEYISTVLPELEPKASAGRVVVAHLGNGASMCAMRGGKSVATTMGFTSVDGLPMGTRCGALDPGVILYMLQELKMDAQTIEKIIYEQSGLLGVSGVSSDMHVLLGSSEPRAHFAVDLFVYRVGRELGSLAAALGGIDVLVFTAGIGENAALIRERVCQGAGWLGVDLDFAANNAGKPHISTANSAVSVWVIPTNEEIMIARHTRQLVTTSQMQPVHCQ